MVNMKFGYTIDAEDVREFCIRNNLYTKGNCEDYDKMLKTVSKTDICTPQLIIAIAKDIVEHSDKQNSEIYPSLENIASYLCDDVMHTGLEPDD